MLLNMAVFGAALSYVLMMVSHIVLRVRKPHMPWPYRTPGGVVTTGFALVVAPGAVLATFLVDPVAGAGRSSPSHCSSRTSACTAGSTWSPRRPMSEEFAALAEAEERLK